MNNPSPMIDNAIDLETASAPQEPNSFFPTADFAADQAAENFRAAMRKMLASAVDAGINTFQVPVGEINEKIVATLIKELKDQGYKTELGTHYKSTNSRSSLLLTITY